MKRITNNILAVLLVMAFLVSFYCNFLLISNLEYIRYTYTGEVAGSVRLCAGRPPVLDHIGNLTAIQNEEFYYDVNASDPDNSTLKFSDNTLLFNINENTGVIQFTPDNDDVYNYTIRITAYEYDSAGCNMSDYEDVNLEVINVNDAPVLGFIPNQTLYEDSYYYYEVNATDPDIEIGLYDALTFGNDPETLFQINAETGRIIFTPIQNDVGNHTIQIYVYDLELKLDYQFVNFEIIGVNDAPRLTPIGALTAEVDNEFVYDVNATDDENDTLTFYDNATFFDIDPITGMINFTPNISLLGTYDINISVTDGQLDDFEVVSFTVAYPNRPPNITSWYPSEVNITMNEGGSQLFNITKYDPDGTTPSTKWYLDSEEITDEIYDNYTYRPDYNSAGKRNITVIITDGLLFDSHSWNVTVNDVEVPQPSAPPPGIAIPIANVSCIENWRCTIWSECYENGTQARTCTDLNDCGTIILKSRELRTCIYTPFPTCFDGILNCHNGSCEILPDCGGPCPPCPTCDDGIQNQNEKGIDCGGPCPPCLVVEKPKPIKEEFITLDIVISATTLLLVLIIIIIYYRIIKKRKREQWMQQFFR